MSDNLFAVIVTCGFFASLALWVPFLETCERLMRRRSSADRSVISADVEELAPMEAGSLALD